MEVNDRIKFRRKQLGLSAEQVAARMDVSPSTVYRYESKDIKNMSIDKLEPIADALETTPQWLMGWTTDSYNYKKDSDGRLNPIPPAVIEKIKLLVNNDLGEAWRVWFVVRHSSNAQQAALNLPNYPQDEIVEIFNLDWDTEAEQFFDQIELSDTDPQVDELLSYANELNAQGKERLCRYAEDLVASGKYQKTEKGVD